VLIVGPLFIRGTVEFGVIPQATMAFAHVLGAFSLVVNQFPSISSYAAVLARLSALVDTAETIAARGAGGITVAEVRTVRTQAAGNSTCCNCGRCTRMVVPFPGWLSRSIVPPKTVTRRLTMCRPRPAPPKSRWIDASAC